MHAVIRSHSFVDQKPAPQYECGLLNSGCCFGDAALLPPPLNIEKNRRKQTVVAREDSVLAVFTDKECERAKSVTAISFLRNLPYIIQGDKTVDAVSTVATQMKMTASSIRQVSATSL